MEYKTLLVTSTRCFHSFFPERIFKNVNPSKTLLSQTVRQWLRAALVSITHLVALCSTNRKQLYNYTRRNKLGKYLTL